MSKVYKFQEFHENTTTIGRPDNYPTPVENNQLFFIQRNQSHNAVVYNVNLTLDGFINLYNPIEIYWLKFDDNKVRTPLNAIQRGIAYGYNFEVITNELIKFNFVSYKKDFFLTKVKGKYCVVTKFEDENCILESFYVHADQFGAFPVVNYVEAYVYTLEKNIKKVIRMNICNT